MTTKPEMNKNKLGGGYTCKACGKYHSTTVRCTCNNTAPESQAHLLRAVRLNYDTDVVLSALINRFSLANKTIQSLQSEVEQLKGKIDSCIEMLKDAPPDKPQLFSNLYNILSK